MGVTFGQEAIQHGGTVERRQRQQVEDEQEDVHHQEHREEGRDE